MSEGTFLYQLARVEAAVVPEGIIVERIEFEPELQVSRRGHSMLELELEWSRFELAEAFRQSWGVEIDDLLLQQEEEAPTGTGLAVRWRELHRGLVLAGRLQQFDQEARLTTVELDADALKARVTARFREGPVTVTVSLGDETDHSWDTVEMLVDAGLALPRDDD